MPDRNITLTDTCGDEIEVLRYDSGEVYLTVNDSGRACQASLDGEGARKLAVALVGDAPGDANLIRASQVSFNEGLMRLAAVHDKVVTFRYAKGDGSIIEARRLLPESVFRNKDGDLLFGGQDPDRGEYRAYRIDRIRGEVSVA